MLNWLEDTVVQVFLLPFRVVEVLYGLSSSLMVPNRTMDLEQLTLQLTQVPVVIVAFKILFEPVMLSEEPATPVSAQVLPRLL